MDVQYIDTPAGRFAVIPEAEFRRLAAAAEDVADSAIVREFERKLAAAEEELLPSAMVDRLLAGESAVKVWREYRGLSAQQLAAKADVSAAYISQIESGKRDGTVSTLRKIADALKVSLDDLA
ncbi:helix-turn-helix domain-containing protein [Inquilinus sp. OTU3971]|uniref:helix-turn-helix domain-containing protein n=1 Tax=Inquilinus sp. OTU3971 TaxID=3043855 RepID=UPI00313CA163